MAEKSLKKDVPLFIFCQSTSFLEKYSKNIFVPLFNNLESKVTVRVIIFVGSYGIQSFMCLYR